MNFVDMLLSANQVKGPLERSAPKRTHRHSTAPTAANNARRSQAIARYREALEGKGWLKSSAITKMMGRAPAASHDALNAYEALGLVEKRPVGDYYVKTRGYEWRWKSGNL